MVERDEGLDAAEELNIEVKGLRAVPRKLVKAGSFYETTQPISFRAINRHGPSC